MLGKSSAAVTLPSLLDKNARDTIKAEVRNLILQGGPFFFRRSDIGRFTHSHRSVRIRGESAFGRVQVPTVKWGESGLVERVGTKFRPQKQRLICMSRLFDFRKHSGEARSIENSLCTTENSPVQSTLCFQGSELCLNSPRQSRLAPLCGTLCHME